MTATPFTAEEAREQAREHAMKAARIRSTDADNGPRMQSELLESMAVEHDRESATLRKYAQMCEAIAEIENLRRAYAPALSCSCNGCSVVRKTGDIIGKLNAEEI